jgi:hypothetical protein
MASACLLVSQVRKYGSIARAVFVSAIIQHLFATPSS